jgi:hypothetical protein
MYINKRKLLRTLDFLYNYETLSDDPESNNDYINGWKDAITEIKKSV